MKIIGAPPTFGAVVERHGRLVRLFGVKDWLAESDLRRPCSCRGTVFLVMQGPRGQRIVCQRCVRPDREEREVGRITAGG